MKNVKLMTINIKMQQQIIHLFLQRSFPKNVFESIMHFPISVALTGLFLNFTQREA